MSTPRSVRHSLAALCIAAFSSQAAAQSAVPPPAPAPARRVPAPPPAQRAPLPPGTPAGTSAAPAAAPVAANDPASYAPGVVILERAGKHLGLGSILNGDGRIVTALFALGGGHNIDARYADGSRVPVRLGHADRTRDLALLVPLNGRHKLGLRASRGGAPPPTSIKSFAPAAGRVVAGPDLAPKGPSNFVSGDGQPLSDMLSFGAEPAASSVGSPLLDQNGEVIAIVTRACRRAPGSGCAAALGGTPVSAVRDFLQKVPASAAIPIAWIGVTGNADDAGSARGVRVASARGPAQTAGLRAGQDTRSADLIVALDGVPVTTPESLDLAIQQRSVGDSVDLLILGGGRFRHVTLVLAAAPPVGGQAR